MLHSYGGGSRFREIFFCAYCRLEDIFHSSRLLNFFCEATFDLGKGEELKLEAIVLVYRVCTYGDFLDSFLPFVVNF